MELISLVGEDSINHAMNVAMQETIRRLCQEDILTSAQANAFLDSHICIWIKKEGGFRAWYNRLFKKDCHDIVRVCRIDVDKDETAKNETN